MNLSLPRARSARTLLLTLLLIFAMLIPVNAAPCAPRTRPRHRGDPLSPGRRHV